MEIDTFSTDQVESGLRDLLAPVQEQIEALDELIEAHEKRLFELRSVRRRAQKVLAAIETPSPNGSPSQRTARLSAVTTERHRRERAEKKTRVVDYVRRHPDDDIRAKDLEGTALGEPPISRGLMYELLRELADENVLRLDRLGSGGMAIYRLARLTDG